MRSRYTGETDAFGVQLKEKDGFLTEVSYRGYAYDADTGKYVLPSRYYDPELGRFLQEDSYWGPGNNQRDDSGRVSIQVIYQSVNLYVYCLSDPVNHTDFNGAVVFSVTLTAQAAAGVGVMAGIGFYIDHQGNFMFAATVGVQVQFGASATVGLNVGLSSSGSVYDMLGWSFSTVVEMGSLVTGSGAIDVSLGEISANASGGGGIGVGVSLTGVTYSNRVTYTTNLCSGNVYDLFGFLPLGEPIELLIGDEIYSITRTEGGLIIGSEMYNIHIWGFGEESGIKVKTYAN